MDMLETIPVFYGGTFDFERQQLILIYLWGPGAPGISPKMNKRNTKYNQKVVAFWDWKDIIPKHVFYVLFNLKLKWNFQ